MKKIGVVIFLALLLLSSPVYAKHLFILSGQSNMDFLPPEDVFIPAIQAKYGSGNVIIVKDAEPGKGIDLWNDGAWLWMRLVDSVTSATMGQQIHTVTFVWMQGESNSGLVASKIYEDKLLDLFSRVAALFPGAKPAYVLGRINDWYMYMGEPGWMTIREIQQRIGEMDRFHAWVNTDDLNGETDDVHMIGEHGYDILGARFAAAAISVTPKRFSLSLQMATRLSLAREAARD